MSGPDYVAQAAELLAKHGACRWITGDRLTCGMPIPDSHGVTVFTAAHLAEVLAAAGLIPTSTEWGVRDDYGWRSDPMPEAQARLFQAEQDRLVSPEGRIR